MSGVPKLAKVAVTFFEFFQMLKSRRNVVVAPKRFLSGFRVATLHTLGRVGSVSFQDLKMKTKSMDNLEALVMQLNQQRYRIDELNTAFKRKYNILVQLFPFITRRRAMVHFHLYCRASCLYILL